MNDTRVDRVAQTIREAQTATDPMERSGLIDAALDEWQGFAVEFPATDLVINVATRRLQTAKSQMGYAPEMAGQSLQMAANAVRAVQQR